MYHGVGTSQVVPLGPLGSQRNAGLLNTIAKMLTGAPDGGGGPSYYVDSSGQGPSTGSVDVGAVVGTAVYSPVDGKVASIRPYVIDGTAHGSVIEIQPTATPADVVTLTNLSADPAIAVGIGRDRRQDEAGDDRRHVQGAVAGDGQVHLGRRQPRAHRGRARPPPTNVFL